MVPPSLRSAQPLVRAATESYACIKWFVLSHGLLRLDQRRPTGPNSSHACSGSSGSKPWPERAVHRRREEFRARRFVLVRQFSMSIESTSMPHASLAPDGAPVGRRHTFLPPRLIRMIDVLQDGEMCDQPRIALAMTRSERVDRCTIASPRSVRHVSTGAGAISARDVGSTGLSASISCSLLLRLRARRERRSRLAVPTMTHAEHPHR